MRACVACPAPVGEGRSRAGGYAATDRGRSGTGDDSKLADEPAERSLPPVGWALQEAWTAAGLAVPCAAGAVALQDVWPRRCCGWRRRTVGACPVERPVECWVERPVECSVERPVECPVECPVACPVALR